MSVYALYTNNNKFGVVDIGTTYESSADTSINNFSTIDIPDQENLFESKRAVVPFKNDEYLEVRSEKLSKQQWVYDGTDRSANQVRELYKSYNNMDFYKGEGRMDLEDILERIHQTIGIYDGNAQSTFTKYTKYYNRFKLPTLNDALQKGFAHVFFIRPDLNVEAMENDPDFYYAFMNSPAIKTELCQQNGSGNDFMLSLSNKAASFSLTDEYIETDTYGKTFAGWKIAYGKHDVESKSAGDFSITYHDDRTLHIYHLHKLWVDYISKCYHGSISPKSEYIKNHELDYASACYYIVTAEDGETIIFWSKYYGVFPSTVPSTQYSWAHGNVIQDTTLEIKYQYSFKEDFNPSALTELNINSGITGKGSKYIQTFNPEYGHAGNTWVGAPYIELTTESKDNKGNYVSESPYTFKLRFKAPE